METAPAAHWQAGVWPAGTAAPGPVYGSTRVNGDDGMAARTPTPHEKIPR